MKFLTHLIIKGQTIPSTVYQVLLLNEDELIATPISDWTDEARPPELHFHKSKNLNYHSLATFDNPLITEILKKLTRK